MFSLNQGVIIKKKKKIPKPVPSLRCKLSFRDSLLPGDFSFSIAGTESRCTIAFIMKILTCSCKKLKINSNPACVREAGLWLPEGATGRVQGEVPLYTYPGHMGSPLSEPSPVTQDENLALEPNEPLKSDQLKADLREAVITSQSLQNLKGNHFHFQGSYRLAAISHTEAFMAASPSDEFVLFMVFGVLCLFVLSCSILTISTNLCSVCSGHREAGKFHR